MSLEKRFNKEVNNFAQVCPIEMLSKLKNSITINIKQACL